MEFDEMKKIWDSQNNEFLYSFNEKALHNRILAKKKQTHHIANFTEWLLVIVNIASGLFILFTNISRDQSSVWMYLLALWMFISALYALLSRIRRIREGHQFDLSMRGDLHHAISAATHQVRISQIMRWNILPIGAFTLLGVWQSGKTFWLLPVALIFFVLVYYASGWEHKIYKNRKRQLEVLRDKLDDGH